ncbi:Poly(U)-specific endoribonuclease-B [Collichthys lucidus]|uniref:Uridylate-specific endoribonuclease n=1 Tax=Collichthys lucidus TaxID=240159 RepID=A0A4U5V6U1_COLLU|nr:Poly(U)-specific endoribonuclease-B [Collichthys lucidus]
MIESDRELSTIAQELWDSDTNRLKPGKDYRISLQGKAGDSMTGLYEDDNDGAGYPLFTFVDENTFKKETFLAFISLLDNYESDTGEPEIVTPEEVAENHKFLDAIIQTSTMKIAHKYLVEKRLSPMDDTKFKEQLYRIWFELYARRGSSQIPQGLNMCLLERLEEGGLSSAFTTGSSSTSRKSWDTLTTKATLSVQIHPSLMRTNTSWHYKFSWKNGIKPKGSIFVGVSPEFEMALYTVCFLSSPNERVKVQFSLYDVEIVCHHYNKKHIGTTYPVLLKYQKPH